MYLHTLGVVAQCLVERALVEGEQLAEGHSADGVRARHAVEEVDLSEDGALRQARDRRLVIGSRQHFQRAFLHVEQVVVDVTPSQNHLARQVQAPLDAE